MPRCSSCSHRLQGEERFCPGCGTKLGSSGSQTGKLSSASTLASPSAPLDQGHLRGRAAPSAVVDRRFPPGTILADRYRVVGLLGRGGMGEVYAAEDLRLAQRVALKFLPAHLGRDHEWLERLHQEVRLARTVTHPNVCRVHDIGEASGHAFLSMELVEGETLAALLKRIGRLPAERGVEIARQLCVGLAAAHDKGILHRDLKPANVMIDAEGRVRITDFGVARLAEEAAEEEVAAGTPAYMAPEQLAGLAVTERSDIYALGLVLYELFTGKRAHGADSLEELRESRRSFVPRPPSSVVADLDPETDRVILRCLETDPQLRPASAIAVAAALPDGDPLQAALAAGVTPSPELVAEAGEVGALSPGWALLFLLAFFLSLAALLALHFSQRPFLLQRVPLEKSPDVLTDRAGAILEELAGLERSSHRAFGFRYDSQSTERFLAAANAPEVRPATIGESPIYYWYRQSPTPFVPLKGWRVTPEQPPPLAAGMASVYLDPAGRLIAFRAVPPAKLDAESPDGVDWGAWFAQAELEASRFVAAPSSSWLPPEPADARFRWTGSDPRHPDRELLVVAATAAGRPVHFAVAALADGPADWRARAAATEAMQIDLFGYPTTPSIVMMVSLFLLAVAWLVRHNLSRRRGDLQGALRVASFVALAGGLRWLLTASHSASVGAQMQLILLSLPRILFEAMVYWGTYLALEPFVRRHWPQNLVAWSRLLAGRVRDPLVGRDLLVGIWGGVAMWVGVELTLSVPAWLGGPQVISDVTTIRGLLGGRYLVGGLIEALVAGVGAGLLLLLGLALIRLWVKTPRSFWWIGLLLVYGGNLANLWAFLRPPYPTDLLLVVSYSLIELAVLVRFGLLASAFTLFFFAWFGLQLPLVDWRLSAWTADASILLVVVTSALALYGFVTARGGRAPPRPA